mmetsp:Transcript_173184/g.555403  ORF Transcript_173184/g.555403 Transcript_173184/m.555403 type:complete len:664 (+) Transcript_173184:23-2014(+)
MSSHLHVFTVCSPIAAALVVVAAALPLLALAAALAVALLLVAAAAAATVAPASVASRWHELRLGREDGSLDLRHDHLAATLVEALPARHAHIGSTWVDTWVLRHGFGLRRSPESGLLRGLGHHNELQLRALVARVDAALALAARLLSELHEDIVGLQVVSDLRLNHLANLCDCVLHHVQQVLDLLLAEVPWDERFLEILRVVEAEVLWREGRSVLVIAIVLEGVAQQVQLKAETQKGPILICEVEEERFAVGDVIDILDTKDIDFLPFELLLEGLHGLGLCLLVVLLGLAILLLPLCGRLLLQPRFLRGLRNRCAFCREESRTLGGVLELHVLGMPALQILLPFLQLLAEVVRGLQILDPSRNLALQRPLSKVGLALSSVLPLVIQLIEALVLVRKGEGGKGGGHCGRNNVRDRSGLSEPIVLLIIGQHHLRGLLLSFLRLLDFHLLVRNLVLLHFGLSCWLGGLFSSGALALAFLHLDILSCLQTLRRILRSLRGLLLCQLPDPLGPLLRNLELPLLLPELLLAGLLHLPCFEGGHCCGMLVLQGLLHGVDLELVIGIADHDPGDLAEVRHAEVLDHVGAVLLGQVALDLHDDHGTALRGRGDGQQALHAAVVELGDAKVHVRPVVRRAVVLGPPQATPHGPIEKLPIAQLRVLRVACQEEI